MRYIIGFLITIGLLIFVFVLIFRGGNDQPANAPAKLVSYANSSTYVQFTEEGPVTANQNHDRIRIMVTNKEATIEVFNGYLGNLTSSTTYPNNAVAYADFLRALDLAGYTLGTKDKALADYRGYCPKGERYIFEIKDGNRSIQSLWSTSCGGASSFKGKAGVVRDLFIAQIPDYNRLTRDVR